MLKNLSEKGKWQLLGLINKSWSEGILQEQWKIGTIIPILKPNKPSNEAGSYRPISNTSTIFKIMEAMVTSRLTNYHEKNKLIAPTQSRFRKKKKKKKKKTNKQTTKQINVRSNTKTTISHT